MANPPPPPATEPTRELMRKNAGAVSRTSSPLKPPPPTKIQEKTLKTHDDGASGLLDQDVILSKIRHFSHPADIMVMSATSRVDFYKGGLFDLGKVWCSF